MKPWVFVSDFDGTVTEKDFYLQMLERRLPHRMEQELHDFATDARSDFDVLAGIFADLGLSEQELEEEIAAIPVDPDFPGLVADVQRLGGDFVILSAGCGYYIRRILQRLELGHLKVFVNGGRYENGGIHMMADPDAFYYSGWYGVDKAKVMEQLRKTYQTVYFAGDSRPDAAPARLADRRFAKAGLIPLLEAEGIVFEPIRCLADIRAALA